MCHSNSWNMSQRNPYRSLFTTTQIWSRFLPLGVLANKFLLSIAQCWNVWYQATDLSCNNRRRPAGIPASHTHISDMLSSLMFAPERNCRDKCWSLTSHLNFLTLAECRTFAGVMMETDLHVKGEHVGIVTDKNSQQWKWQKVMSKAYDKDAELEPAARTASSFSASLQANLSHSSNKDIKIWNLMALWEFHTGFKIQIQCHPFVLFNKIFFFKRASLNDVFTYKKINTTLYFWLNLFQTNQTL